MMGWYGGWGAGAWMGIGMLLFWALVIALVIALMRSAGPGRVDYGRDTTAGRRPADALGVLDERFARGELNEVEYRERRSILIGQ